jgi:hypothetical protein
VWASTTTFAIGDVWLGIRSNDDAFDSSLRRALQPYVAEGVEAPPNFWCKLAGPVDAKGRRGLHFLYRGSTTLVRTRNLQRLRNALLLELGAYAAAPDPSMLSLAAVGFVSNNGRAVLAPPGLRPWLSAIERRLNARGLWVVDTPTTLVDAERSELVVPEPALDIDWSAFQPDGSDRDGVVQPGRYPIAGWAFFTDTASPEVVTRARAVAIAAQFVTNIDALGVQTSLDRIAGVVRTIEPTALTVSRPGDVVQPLAALG